MDGTIRVRFPDEMFWGTVSYDTALNWGVIEVGYMDDEACFVRVDGQSLQMHRQDYDNIMNNKVFNFKFNLSKHTLNKK